jgi:hypothetical protein
MFDAFGQKWVSSISHTTTLFGLPIITYIITQAISGNIALSLGMVGALSIVRFRHPVRSPLELTTYFGMITLGITAGVDVKWSLFLLGSLGSAAVFLWVINNVFKHALGKNFFHLSFTDAIPKSTLHIETIERMDILEMNRYLSSQSFSNNVTQYVLSSYNNDDLQQILNKVNESELLQSYNFIRN